MVAGNATGLAGPPSWPATWPAGQVGPSSGCPRLRASSETGWPTSCGRRPHLSPVAIEFRRSDDAWSPETIYHTVLRVRGLAQGTGRLFCAPVGPSAAPLP